MCHKLLSLLISTLFGIGYLKLLSVELDFHPLLQDELLSC